MYSTGTTSAAKGAVCESSSPPKSGNTPVSTMARIMLIAKSSSRSSNGGGATAEARITVTGKPRAAAWKRRLSATQRVLK